MDKVYVQKLVQNGRTFYAAVLDPRKVADLLPDIDAGEDQEAQRPWKASKVKQIAKYVAGRMATPRGEVRTTGLIPTAPVIALQRPFVIKQEPVFDSGGRIAGTRYFLELPVTEEEKIPYKGKFIPIDGQHRLISFKAECMDPQFKSSERYDMLFSLFTDMDKQLKVELFTTVNEKQDKVESNLLRNMKRQLGFLDDHSELLAMISETLNTEDYSPLKGRIAFGGKKVPRGYKEAQIAKVLNYTSPDLRTLVTRYGGEAGEKLGNLCRYISAYIKAWEMVCGASFQNPSKPQETMTKMCGLRYIMLMLPQMHDLIVKKQIKGTTENFASLIRILHFEILEVENLFEAEHLKRSFASETGTATLAREHQEMLYHYFQNSRSDFDPTTGI